MEGQGAGTVVARMGVMDTVVAETSQEAYVSRRRILGLLFSWHDPLNKFSSKLCRSLVYVVLAKLS